MCELYKRINALCEKRGITGYKLCKDIEMRPSILTDLKMGRTAILSTVNLNKIANYFSVSVDYLLNGEKETIKKEQPTISEDDELNEYLDLLRTRPECRMFLDTIKGATKEEVEENVRFIEALRKAKG